MIALASPGVRRILPALAFGFACSAQAAAPQDPLAWLQRAAQAAHLASYAGTFVHTNGERTSTVRITHVAAGGEEHERIEPLAGATHDFGRRNEEMFCSFPDGKTVRLDRRVTARFFPALLGHAPDPIAESYDVKLGKTERVLGYDCQWIRLEPRDGLRFPQRICAEFNTGLVLRAKTLNDKRQVIEQYTFTDLKIGPQVVFSDVRSIFRARSRQWVTDGKLRDDTANAETGWAVTRTPAGFQKIAELKRALPGRVQPVSQIVLSDGLASMSVFVEPNTAPVRTEESASEDGTTTFFVRPMGDLMVTVLGEVPLATAQQVGRSVAKRQ